MRTSYLLLRHRFRRSQPHFFPSIPIVKPSLRFTNFSHLLLFHTSEHRLPRPPNSGISQTQSRSYSQLRGIFPTPPTSKRFVLLGLLGLDGHRHFHHHHHHHHQYSAHRCRLFLFVIYA